jgi:hypothetical protein
MAKKRIAWMLGATLSGGGAVAQRPSPRGASPTVVVSLRVMDGETGMPMRSPSLELGCRTESGQRCRVQRRVETKAEWQRGIVKYEVSTDAAAIYEASARDKDCNLWTETATDEPLSTRRGGLSADRILKSGVTLANSCRLDSSRIAVAEPVAKPGEVILYYHQPSWRSRR